MATELRAAKRRKAYRSTPEGMVLNSIREYLLVKKILHFRMQTGAHVASYGGRTRMIRYGTPGMADILAFPELPHVYVSRLDGVKLVTQPFWIEVKAENGRQSPDQSAFQKIVEDNGHWYLLARGIDDVERFLRDKGVVR